jgi:hypothetical protein
VQLASFLDGSNEVLAAKMKIKVSKETAEDDEEVPNPAYDLWRAQE